MKLFWRENTPLIFIQLCQFVIILVVYWLDGYRSIETALYAIFLGFFLLCCYLTYNYFHHRSMYTRLNTPLKSLDDSLQRPGSSPMSQALEDLLRDQYKHYQKQIKALERQQLQHMTYMEQWVHQMKTPLSVIELTAQNLDEPDSSNIREETERMKTGLNTILYMARLRSIERDFHIKPVKLSNIVNDVNREHRRFYIRNNVFPKLQETRSDITVESDEKWLHFILTQLIQNAVKYSAGKSNHIIISIYEQDRKAVLEVRDFGVGIPEADKRRVFDPFFTGENGRKFRESTGMGLYLTKEAADQLGHTMEFESEVQQGTTFRVFFSPEQNLTTM